MSYSSVEIGKSSVIYGSAQVQFVGVLLVLIAILASQLATHKSLPTEQRQELKTALINLDIGELIEGSFQFNREKLATLVYLTQNHDLNATLSLPTQNVESSLNLSDQLLYSLYQSGVPRSALRIRLSSEATIKIIAMLTPSAEARE